MRTRWRVFIAAAFCLLFRADIAMTEMVDRTVAVVNGEIILYSELQEQIKLMAKLMPDFKSDDPARKAVVERDVLQQIIRQKLTEAEVRRLNVKVTDREVDDSIADMKRETRVTDAQFLYQLNESGQTLEKFRSGVRKELERNRLLERVVKSKTVVTEAQVDAYLKESGRLESSGGVRTESIRIGLIFLPADGGDGRDGEKTGRELVSRLKGGGDFHQLAQQYSKGSSAKDGGDLGYMSPEEMQPSLAIAVKGMKKNEVSDLVKGPGGYYILKVLDIREDKQSKSDPELRNKVRQMLLQQELGRKFEEWVKELESKAFIQISL